MNKKKSILALLLLVPAPSIGVLSAMVWFPNSWMGMMLFALSKLWLFGFPVIWHRVVEHGSLSFSPARKGGLAMGVLSGMLISAAIVLAYVTLGPRMIDRSFLVRKMADIGLAPASTYASLAVYWIVINSVLEEYVWRWFVFRQCETVFKPAVAIGCAALFFTLHHFAALRVYCGLPAAVICSMGVFSGGALWSFMYRRYQSIWPGYLSHAIVDLCVFLVGAVMIFGGRAP